MNRNLNVETSRGHSSTSLAPLRTTSTAATHSMATRFRRRLGPAPLALLALLALALAVPVREASAQPVTLPATAVTSRSATLNGTIYQGWGWLVQFDWGIGTPNGNYTSITDVGTGTNTVPFSAQLLWLTPNTTYHFRAVAYHGDAWDLGGDQSFTTLPDTVPFGFTINSGAITITGYGGAGGAVSIPSTINGLPVTSIGDLAFEQCTNLTSVTIPDSVTNIGGYAFSLCTGLASITIPNSVTSIGGWAFDACTNLTSVTIPNSVTSIAFQAFDNCTSLTNVTIGNGVISIGQGAFAYCTSLTSVMIPNSVTSVGDGAFEDCTSLSTVTIPNSVTNIGGAPFSWCTSLSAITVDALNPAYRSVDGVLFNKSQTTLLQCPGGKAGTYTIPNSVTNIEWGAFYGCASLTNIMIPTSLTSIGLAFEDCSGLTSITIPNSVSSIGGSAFVRCTNLTTVTIAHSITNIGDYAFYYCPSLTGVYFEGNAPSLGGAYVFQWDTNATVYYLPGTTGWGTTFGGLPTALWQSPPPGVWTSAASSITTNSATLSGTVNPNGWPTTAWFQWGATTDYGNLTSVTNLGSGSNALPLSAPLAGLTLGVTYHFRVAATNDYGLFYGSDQSFTTESLEAHFYYTTNNGTITITRYFGSGGAVTIPDTITGLPVTTIGQYLDWYNGGWLGAFQGCSSLTSVTISPNVTTIEERAFCNCSHLASITLSNNVVEIGDGAFQQCTGLTNVTILHSVTSIGQYAFLECASLTSVTISNSVASIGLGAFAQCPWLSLVTLGNGVSSIGANAFAECLSLTNVLIPSSVTNIEEGAFVDCTSLSAITVDAVNPTYSSADGVLFNKSQTMLSSCPQGKAGSYTIPTGVTSIGDGAFGGCTRLTSVTIPNSVTSIRDWAFSDCTNLASITIPNSVTNIGQGAFCECTMLTSFTIPGGVTSIAIQTFQQCGSLANVTIADSVTSIGVYAFAQCTSLTGVVIPNSVTNIGESAFGWCTRLTSITIPGSITSIANGTFDGCSSLTSVTIPNSVTSIGTNAFNGCTRLTSITIPSGVTCIGDWAFYECPSLTAVSFEGNAPSLCSSVFYGDNNATVYYLPGTTGWDTTYGGRPTAVWWIPPTIQASPLSQMAEAGSTVDLRVDATGPLYYLWYLNHTNLISCSTNRDLELTNVQFSQSGVYTAVITNVAGAVTSSPAMLQVIAPVERRPVPGVKVMGEAGSLLNVDYANSLSPAPNWTPLGSASLIGTSQYYFDVTMPLLPQRFYRAWQTGNPGVTPSLTLDLIPAITLTGSIGASVRLDYISRFGPIDAWVTLATVTLTNASQLYFDTSAPGQPQRLYRLVPSP